MGPETLKALREKGMLLDPKYDLLVNAYKEHMEVVEKKVVEIKFLSALLENDIHTVNVEFIAQYVKEKKATIFLEAVKSNLIDAQNSTFGMSKKVIFTGEKNTYKFEFQNNMFAPDQYKKSLFKATIICDGITAETKAFKLGEDKAEYKPEKCLCKKTSWTADDLRYIVTQLRKLDTRKLNNITRDKRGNYEYLDKNGKVIPSTDRGNRPEEAVEYNRVTNYKPMFDEIATDKKQIEDRLFYLNRNENVGEIDKSFEKLAKALNYIFKKLEAKKCINKIHILCQIYHETERFGSCYESDVSAEKSGEDFYRGRGLIMLTSKKNYAKFYFDTYNKNPSDSELEILVPKVAKELDYAKLTASWYLTESKIKKYFNEEDSVLNVSACINRPNSLIDKKYDEMYGIPEREKYFDLLKLILDYDNCK